jgi:hypothetical protein
MPQAKKAKRKKWEGQLGLPIPRVSEDFARWFCRKRPSVDPVRWIEEQVERERHAKLPLLLKHYGVAGQTGRDFFGLAKCLAIDFVPGFKVAELAPQPVGAPGRWTKTAGAVLIGEVDVLKEADGLTAAEAIRLIRKLDPKRYGKMNERSLRKRYDEARKRFGR